MSDGNCARGPEDSWSRFQQSKRWLGTNQTHARALSPFPPGCFTGILCLALIHLTKSLKPKAQYLGMATPDNSGHGPLRVAGFGSVRLDYALPRDD
ncbi:hypothetical protein BDV23DRAFT_99016 [Aspergillus alliaceus]|uniref:Uncharacterized protein n=1 Tax=Petromyces alliaceus TaxID=209559 RepID=A0A5N7C5Y8_PETAA|nr:hypothetical protein BDV23DRAFT_99016 [Aspergillus alliaceus]